MSAIYPGESGLTGFWRTITTGRDAISEVPPSHWLIEDYFDADPKAPDKTYCKRGGFIDPVNFDPVQFGLPPNALPSTDTGQILALIAARQVLDEVQRSGAEVDLDRVDVVLGVASTTELVVQMGSRMQRPIWRKALLENGLSENEADEICQDIADHYVPWQESTFPGLLGNVIAGRVANRLNLGGANFVTDAACGSSLAALQSALHRLYLHESDVVLTGGVDTLNDIMMFMCFSKTPAFSATGDCRPFSDGADGTIIGEGIGMVALKRLADAERDGDQIHAVIRGLGSSSDGRASSVYAPRSEGQAKALRRAYERAGYDPSTVELIEAHGTATKSGRRCRIRRTEVGVHRRLGANRPRVGEVSDRPHQGRRGRRRAHQSRAGATAFNTSRHHQGGSPEPRDGGWRRHRSTSTHRPAPGCGRATNRVVRRSAHLASGGSNFHVTLEEYQGEHRAKRLRALPSELVVLSAQSEADLQKRAADIVAAARSGESLARIAFEAAEEFDASRPARAGLVATDVKSLETVAERLRSALADGKAAELKDADIAVGFGPAREGKTAFLFPGQGSQYVGMGGDLALSFPEALAVWDGLEGDLTDLPGVVFPEPAFDASAVDAQKKELTAMANAQPAIAATSLAQLALLDVLGVSATAAAGHSFGEVTALAAAGVLPTERLVETARTRGTLMNEAGQGKDGAMLAVSATADDVRALLDTNESGSLVIANDNAPTQVVLAGYDSDIAWAQTAAKAKGWTAVRLPVASAFHSEIVAASCAPLTAYLKTLKIGQPNFPVYANATAQQYGEDVAEQLGDQVQRVVRFREMIEAMARDGVTRFIEVGPGRVLTGLVGKILGTSAHIAVALDDPKAGGLRGWHRGLAALAADGVALDLVALFDHYEEPQKFVPAPKHVVKVGGANLGKPYPPVDGKKTITPKRTRVSVQSALPAVAETPAPAPAVQRMEAPAVHAPAPAAQVQAPVVQQQAQVVHHQAEVQAEVIDAPLSGDVWSIIDSIQKETAEQHQRYMDVVTQSHQAFLDMSTQMMAQIVGDPATVAQAPRALPSVATATGFGPCRCGASNRTAGGRRPGCACTGCCASRGCRAGSRNTSTSRYHRGSCVGWSVGVGG